jgi:hypothetical protein
VSPPKAVTDEGDPYREVAMKKPILKRKTRNWVIVALVVARRYLWPVLAVWVSPVIGGKNTFLWMGILIILLEAYTFIGYKLRWKHMFCYYQKIHRKEMTPDNIRWGIVKKSDVYGETITFGVLGVACIVLHYLFHFM